MNSAQLWDRYRKYLCRVEGLGLTLDVSRMRFDEAFLKRMAAPLARAFDAMRALENGALANPDERRMVGHYWLRAPELAPNREIADVIVDARHAVHRFAADVHAGTVKPQAGGRFEHMLVVGIGGSALGPQFVVDALATTNDPLATYFFDNTDPDGMERVLARLKDRLITTLTIVTSKSGGTQETRNGMLTAAKAYQDVGLDFSRHAVAITAEGSELDRTALNNGWIARFPMWNWVGGRTSELSAVGLLPAALQGFDIDAMLTGARDMDVVTRARDVKQNPAAMLALMWYHAGDGKGLKDMVVLPYKDRLILFSRYLQQLVMESLGKERDLAGHIVHQGIAVYGNKGSTDQHAYVQQLREGIPNFFVTFIQVLHDQEGASLEVEKDVNVGDFLLGSLLGTRDALFENARESITITVDEVNEKTIGALIALYERAVGLYASMVGINAYHQPGVEAGKRAASGVIAVQRAILTALQAGPTEARTATDLARAAGTTDRVETVHKVLEHLAANGRVQRFPGAEPTAARYSRKGVI
ncbi:MAG TPA: glucose-6-phosphate isomerase [Candidatus Binataceae bacterium]|nr:glucose-6-phosphate isomerase [Candidatus Binataceae bacterium]